MPFNDFDFSGGLQSIDQQPLKLRLRQVFMGLVLQISI
jgi:hypothetical protein